MESIHFIVINRTKEESSVKVIDIPNERTGEIKKKMIINLNLNDNRTIDLAFEQAIDFDVEYIKRKMEIVK